MVVDTCFRSARIIPCARGAVAHHAELCNVSVLAVSSNTGVISAWVSIVADLISELAALGSVAAWNLAKIGRCASNCGMRAFSATASIICTGVVIIAIHWSGDVAGSGQSVATYGVAQVGCCTSDITARSEVVAMVTSNRRRLASLGLGASPGEARVPIATFVCGVRAPSGVIAGVIRARIVVIARDSSIRASGRWVAGADNALAEIGAGVVHVLAAVFGVAAIRGTRISVITIDLRMVAPSGCVAEVIGTSIAVITSQSRVNASRRVGAADGQARVCIRACVGSIDTTDRSIARIVHTSQPEITIDCGVTASG